ncbi:TPA: tail fiber assembly protein [Citrobacter braakii]|nr:tail fiber assembly protein [Citrobacter braakii]
MQNIKNFSRGNPVTIEQMELAKHNVLFLFSEDGLEWYESQKHFSADTIKFTYDTDNIIRSISKDVSMLWPENMSVAEVSDTTANRRMDIKGGWIFDGNKVMPRIYTADELHRQTELKKKTLLAEADATIAPLERAVRLGMATEDEIRRLEAWERYSVLVSRVKQSDEWPEKPE